MEYDRSQGSNDDRTPGFLPGEVDQGDGIDWVKHEHKVVFSEYTSVPRVRGYIRRYVVGERRQRGKEKPARVNPRRLLIIRRKSYWTAAFSFSASSPERYISSRISEPPINSPPI